jgi:5-formyltetrahydrofolate cyclo-ligase
MDLLVPAAQTKAALRDQALAKRELAREAAIEETFDAQSANLLDLLSDKGFVAEGKVVAGYWPIGAEADPIAAMQDLQASGVAVALPCIEGPDLTFRALGNLDALVAGPKGTQQPPASNALLRPAALIVPLLAFDLRGARLGYGKGYYDRALRALRATGPIFAVGLAFEAQRIDILPWEEWDEPLDAVVTEVRIREFSRSVR